MIWLDEIKPAIGAPSRDDGFGGRPTDHEPTPDKGPAQDDEDLEPRYTSNAQAAYRAFDFTTRRHHIRLRFLLPFGYDGVLPDYCAIALRRVEDSERGRSDWCEGGLCSTKEGEVVCEWTEASFRGRKIVVPVVTPTGRGA